MTERHVSPTPHDAMLTRWRSRVASRSSSPTTSTPEIPTAPILPAPSAVVAPSTDIISLVDAPPEIRRRRAILIRPGEDIPIGRLYRTHPGGPCRALTVRKSVRPLPSHRLALRYTSHHLDHFTSGSSSSHSSSDHSSSGHSISGHSLFGHTPPDTTDADSSTPQRFVHPSLARTPRCSEAYLRWRSAPLSTMYPPMTSESSVGDSSEDTGIDMEVDVEDDVKEKVKDEVESSDRDTMEVGVDVVVGINNPDGMLMPNAVECLEQVEKGLQNIRDHVMKIPLQRIVGNTKSVGHFQVVIVLARS
ncbi:hypothetical protein Tco_0905957 [Tanacetum coccineum]